MKYFENINTLEELKKAYRKLAMQHHPDKGGSTEIMQEINNEYDLLFNSLKNKHNETSERKINETPDQFRAVIEKIINIPGIIIELCGSWVWVSGNTAANKDALKAAGMYWAAKKKMWYWRAPEDAHRGKGTRTMSEIRAKYGSERITSDGRIADALTA